MSCYLCVSKVILHVPSSQCNYQVISMSCYLGRKTSCNSWGRTSASTWTRRRTSCSMWKTGRIHMVVMFWGLSVHSLKSVLLKMPCAVITIFAPAGAAWLHAHHQEQLRWDDGPCWCTGTECTWAARRFESPDWCSKVNGFTVPLEAYGHKLSPNVTFGFKMRLGDSHVLRYHSTLYCTPPL